MDMNNLREKLDLIDDQMIKLFSERMATCKDIAKYKKENNLAIKNKTREREIINRLTMDLDPDIEGYARVLFTTIMEMSCSYQYKQFIGSSEFESMLKEAVENTAKLFPEKATVACQGLEGSYSQFACDKIFKTPNIMYFQSFEGVFQAVQSGFCKYGILPLENSSAGSVNEVYDLMHKYNFYIVRGTKLYIQHTLLSKNSAKLSDIKEIFSHEQALNQCSEFLKTLPNIKITVCENTASAAQIVAQSERRDIAAISSEDCAGLYNLSLISRNVQNTDNNRTRFICISKNLEIYPGASKTSIMLTLPHKPGSLYNVLSKFNSLGISLNKLESRPILGRDFEFKFYFDIEVSMYSSEFCQIIGEIQNEVDDFDYLGSYLEI